MTVLKTRICPVNFWGRGAHSSNLTLPVRSMKAHKVASRSGAVRVTSNLQVMDVTGSSNREVDLSNKVLRKKFDSMVNLDGKINKEAMRELLQCSETLRISNDWLSDDEINSLLERYTQNGVLTYENFVSIAEDSVMVAAKIEELMIAFTMIDHEGEGKVGKEDLSLLFRQLGQKLTDEELDKIFKEADTNKNGVISFTEFLFMARSHLIDLAEVLAYVQLEKGPQQLGIPKSMQRKVAVSRMRTELKEQWAGAFPEGEDPSEEGAEPPIPESAEKETKAPEPSKKAVVEVEAEAVVHNVSGEADIRALLGEKDRLCVLMVGFTFCRPCKRFTRPYEKISQKYPQICFMKMMGNESEETKRVAKDILKLKVSPMFYFLKGGNAKGDIIPLREHSGAREDRLMEALRALVPELIENEEDVE